MQALRVGPALVYLRERRVFVDGVERRLGGRAFDLMLALLQAPERVVGRDELYETVWSDTAVEPNNLAVQMLALRRLLGPGAVLTVPRRGYRLVAPVRPLGTAQAAPADGSEDAPALQSMAQWLADRLQHERWLTLAGAAPARRLAVALAVCDLHGQGQGRDMVVWQLHGAATPLPDAALRRRLAGTSGCLLVHDADRARREALADWLAGVPPGSALRVLCLASGPGPALAGEGLVVLPEAGHGTPPAPPAGAAPDRHPLRRSVRGGLRGKAK